MAQSDPVQDSMERALGQDVTSFGYLYPLRVSDMCPSAVSRVTLCVMWRVRGSRLQFPALGTNI